MQVRYRSEYCLYHFTGPTEGYGTNEEYTKDVEQIKKNFGGRELLGKTIGVAGLGNIGCLVVEAALELGMHVVGYDPMLTVDAAFRLPGDRMERVDSLESLLMKADYVSLHIPMIKGVTEHVSVRNFHFTNT